MKHSGETILHQQFRDFGVAAYHARGVFGQGVSMLIIDTGCSLHGKTDHGVLVSSIISPDPNEYGFVGVAPSVSLDLADVKDPSSIPIDVVIDALQKGIDLDVDIISISLGTDDAFEPLQDALRDADKKGILVFAAAGNSGGMGYEFPAAYDRAISVASINSARQPSHFNTRNDAVAVFAPGENLRLPTSNGEFEFFSGTSFATPFAAGLAALVLSEMRATKKGVRIPRREMVAILRNAEHLNNNCDDHVFVMDGPSCLSGSAERVVTKKDAPSAQVPFAFVSLFLLVCGCVWLLQSRK